MENLETACCWIFVQSVFCRRRRQFLNRSCYCSIPGPLQLVLIVVVLICLVKLIAISCQVSKVFVWLYDVLCKLKVTVYLQGASDVTRPVSLILAVDT